MKMSSKHGLLLAGGLAAGAAVAYLLLRKGGVYGPGTNVASGPRVGYVGAFVGL